MSTSPTITVEFPETISSAWGEDSSFSSMTKTFSSAIESGAGAGAGAGTGSSSTDTHDMSGSISFPFDKPQYLHFGVVKHRYEFGSDDYPLIFNSHTAVKYLDLDMGLDRTSIKADFCQTPSIVSDSLYTKTSSSIFALMNLGLFQGYEFGGVSLKNDKQLAELTFSNFLHSLTANIAGSIVAASIANIKNVTLCVPEILTAIDHAFKMFEANAKCTSDTGSQISLETYQQLNYLQEQIQIAYATAYQIIKQNNSFGSVNVKLAELDGVWRSTRFLNDLNRLRKLDPTVPTVSDYNVASFGFDSPLTTVGNEAMLKFAREVAIKILNTPAAGRAAGFDFQVDMRLLKKDFIHFRDTKKLDKFTQLMSNVFELLKGDTQEKVDVVLKKYAYDISNFSSKTHDDQLTYFLTIFQEVQSIPELDMISLMKDIIAYTSDQMGSAAQKEFVGFFESAIGLNSGSAPEDTLQSRIHSFFIKTQKSLWEAIDSSESIKNKFGKKAAMIWLCYILSTHTVKTAKYSLWSSVSLVPRDFSLSITGLAATLEIDYHRHTFEQLKACVAQNVDYSEALHAEYVKTMSEIQNHTIESYENALKAFKELDLSTPTPTPNLKNTAQYRSLAAYSAILSSQQNITFLKVEAEGRLAKSTPSDAPTSEPVTITSPAYSSVMPSGSADEEEKSKELEATDADTAGGLLSNSDDEKPKSAFTTPLRSSTTGSQDSSLEDSSVTSLSRS